MNNEVEQLRTELKAFKEEYYRGNFSSKQDFYKSSDFKTRLKVPHYDSLPTTCEIGEIAESAGKLRVCSAANTWTIVGTQS